MKKLLLAAATVFLTSVFGIQSALAIPTSFDVTSLSALDTFGATATGTSNGVGWTLGPSHFSSCCGATINSTFNGFNNANFITPVANTDNLHITQANFSLTFDQAITSIVFYIQENGGTASLDFGIAPTVLSGGANLSITGTRISPNTVGGAIEYSGLNTTTLNHGSVVFDGMNMAFFVTGVASIVPEPGTLSLLGVGLIALGFMRRKRAA